MRLAKLVIGCSAIAAYMFFAAPTNVVLLIWAVFILAVL
ncbi:hypothetical protein EcMJ_230 [Escherichia phage vB_Ec-M-J]|uniref:Uncharacterized protein n=1 Tax=Escherichia phage fEgEco12 TaxID=3158837 RepID=A0AAU7PGN1_9CAUD|nr:hypothetical protein EcMJ_230 [Escherichia phage vB_Ec-M-J]